MGPLILITGYYPVAGERSYQRRNPGAFTRMTYTPPVVQPSSARRPLSQEQRRRLVPMGPDDSRAAPPPLALGPVTEVPYGTGITN